ncbi:MAG: AfsR/SARP family transcriptional regulator, partial [Stackebrandtia sp.]
MDIRLLGPVRVLDRGRTLLRARRRERLLLGLLALESGRSIPVNRLIELLWSGEPPKRPRETLQVYVSRLRTQLAGVDGRPGLRITHHGDGYLLHAEPETVDVHRFLAKYAAAADIADPVARSDELLAALKMWEGPLLADAADEGLRARLGGRFESARQAAVELRVEADLQ